MGWWNDTAGACCCQCQLTMDRGPTALKSSLFRRYFTALFIVVAIPLLIKSISDAWFGYRDQRAMLDALLRTQAMSAASRIENFLFDIRDQLHWTVHEPWSAASAGEHYLDLVRLMRQVPAVWSVALVDSAGREKLYLSRIDLNRIPSGRDYSKNPAFIETRLGRPWMSPMEYLGDADPRMSIAVAADRRNGDTAIADINLTLIRDVISRIHIGETGYAFVIDQRGQLVGHPDISKVLRGNHSIERTRQLKAAFTASPRQAIATTDLDGVSVLATMTPPLEGIGWNVFAVQPVSEALAPVYLALWRTGGLLLLAALIAGMVAWLLARRMTEPIRLLEEGARHIGAGQFDRRITISTGDELERLATSFNRMAEELALSQERSERIARLKRFLPSQVAELVEKTGDETVLAGQRAEIVAVFCDLRGFTAFTTRAEPEEIVKVLGDYYRALGAVITRYQATLTNFSADGLMVLVNAPVPCPEPALHAAKMAIEMRVAVHQLGIGWRGRGFDIGFGMGMAMGWATVGRIGYEGRVDYTAIGNAVNLASRLCSAAEDQQILCDQVVAQAVSAGLPVESLGMRQLKGFDRQVSIYALALAESEASDKVVRLVKD
jgi:adenylate cyclase